MPKSKLITHVLFVWYKTYVINLFPHIYLLRKVINWAGNPKRPMKSNLEYSRLQNLNFRIFFENSFLYKYHNNKSNNWNYFCKVNPYLQKKKQSITKGSTDPSLFSYSSQILNIWYRKPNFHKVLENRL